MYNLTDDDNEKSSEIVLLSRYKFKKNKLLEVFFHRSDRTPSQ